MKLTQIPHATTVWGLTGPMEKRLYIRALASGTRHGILPGSEEPATGARESLFRFLSFRNYEKAANGT